MPKKRGATVPRPAKRKTTRPVAVRAVAEPAPVSDPIEHVIVLMLENRSFDHFLGAMPGVNGVKPSSPNTNSEGPGSSKSYKQTADAVRKMNPDPHHETKNVMRQI